MNLDNKKKGVLMVLFFVLIISVLGFFYLLHSDKVPEPVTYVTKQKREIIKTTFFVNEVVRLPTSANITQPNSSSGLIRVGIDSSTDALNFGRVFPDMPVRKYIELENSEGYDVRVCVRRYGSISPYLNSSVDSFILESGEGRDVMVSFVGKKLGHFEGEVDIVIRKMRYKELVPLLYWMGC
ncbi:MAG: hypothetical protein B6U72_00380 [Candidatus Altiarchaeales archaeon ex4484_2]|nr:MAG: hypothetical protein B6U72_00380 [Candidatus Altiarchaeales archaeon ex4484_2]